MPDDVPVTELIRVEHDGPIARITLNRPDAGNSLTPDMRDHLADVFDELSATLGVRAVVLTGAGEKHFCTGAGLGGAQKPEPPRPDGRARQGARRRGPAGAARAGSGSSPRSSTARSRSSRRSTAPPRAGAPTSCWPATSW